MEVGKYYKIFDDRWIGDIIFRLNWDKKGL